MNLIDIAKKYETDKVEHGYCKYYEKHFDNKTSGKKLLELGVFRGASLLTWSEWLKNPIIYGVDIDSSNILPECCNDKNINILIGDANNPSFLILQKNNGQFDYIIDDASHQRLPIQKTFDILWDSVKAGGYYVIEDLATSYWKDYDGGIDTYNTIAFIKTLIDSLHYKYHLIPINKYIDQIDEIHIYDEIVFIKKKG